MGMGMACSLRKPATWHAVVAVFLQFFSWGVITAPMIKILNSEFGHNALLLNGIIMGVKGFLSFLSAPLIGALSDVYGRKLFLLITAFFTCVPIRSGCDGRVKSFPGLRARHCRVRSQPHH